MRTAIAVVAVLTAVGLSGCAMNSNCCNNGSGGLLGGFGGCNVGCQTGGGCDSGCGCSTDASCGGKCGSQCGCSRRGLYPGPLAAMRMRQDVCDPCGDCNQPRVGMGEMALLSRGMRRGACCNSCGSNEKDCGCENAGMIRGRMLAAQDRMSGMRDRMVGCGTCGKTDGCECSRGGLLSGFGNGNFLRSTEPRMNVATCNSCGNNCGGSCGGGIFGGGGRMLGRCGSCGQNCGGRCGGARLGAGGLRGACGPGCRRCGGRGLCNAERQHPYGNQIPHTDQFGGPHGPISPTYAYPYYTTRGPRDFFTDNPATIGR